MPAGDGRQNPVHHNWKSTVNRFVYRLAFSPLCRGCRHARNHVYAILDATNGALLDTQSFPTTAADISRAIKWVARRTEADADTLWVIEGAAFNGFPVAEAPHMDAKKNRASENQMPLIPAGWP